MARIRPYTQQVETSAGIPTRQASPDDLGGPGLANLGQAIQQAGMNVARASAIDLQEERRAQEKIDHQKKQASSIAAHRIIADAQNQALMEEQERQKRVNPAQADLHLEETITYGKQQQEEAINKIVEDPHSPVLPEDYETIRWGIENNSKHIALKASEFAAKTGAAYQIEELGKTTDTLRNTIQNDPGLLDNALNTLRTLTDGITTVGEAPKQKLYRAERESFFAAAVDGMIDQAAKSHSLEEIRQLRESLTKTMPTDAGGAEPNTWQKEMSPAAYAKALDRLNLLEQSEAKQKDLLLDAAFKERRDERAAGVSNGFDPAKESAHVTDPAKRELLIRDGQAAIRTGNAIQEMHGGSFAENMKRLADGDAALQTSGNFHADAEVQKARHAVMSQKLQSIKNDLAAEALKNPVVLTAYQEMQSGKPEAVDRYVRAMQAETERIAPWREVRLLPDAYEGQIKHVLGEMEAGPRGADQALQMLATERTRWGRHWPTVLKQLTQDEVLSGPQAVAARMGQDPSALPDAKRLLITAGLKPEQINDLTPARARHDVQEALLKELTPVAEALRGQVSGERELARYRDASEILALSYLMPGGGETSPEKAAVRAAGVVIKNGFHWVESYYVPKQYNPDVIRQSADMERQFVPVKTVDESLRSGRSVDPSTFGTRPDGTPKGLGYFGVLQRPDGGISTELSMGFEVDGKQVEMPAINPLTTRKELDYLLSGGTGNEALDKSIADKAYRFGMSRIKQGKSPFAQEGEQQLPPSAMHVIPPKSSGLHPRDVTEAVKDSLKHRSRWVVNREGNGLDLVWETGEQVLIQNSDGTVTPYSRTFQYLQEMGTPTKDWFGRSLKPETK